MMDETGLRLEELDTPFLWVDLDQLEENIAELAAFFREARVGSISRASRCRRSRTKLWQPAHSA
jgi:D-serine deaminase-like pyridoxal phosphate-dependent protein